MIHRQLHKAERAGIAKRRCIAGGMELEDFRSTFRRKALASWGACSRNGHWEQEHSLFLEFYLDLA
jgi:hypothetical protein